MPKSKIELGESTWLAIRVVDIAVERIFRHHGLGVNFQHVVLTGTPPEEEEKYLMRTFEIEGEVESVPDLEKNKIHGSVHLRKTEDGSWQTGFITSKIVCLNWEYFVAAFDWNGQLKVSVRIGPGEAILSDPENPNDEGPQLIPVPLDHIEMALNKRVKITIRSHNRTYEGRLNHIGKNPSGQDYIVVDVGFTTLSPHFDDIEEISLLK